MIYLSITADPLTKICNCREHTAQHDTQPTNTKHQCILPLHSQLSIINSLQSRQSERHYKEQPQFAPKANKQ